MKRKLIYILGISFVACVAYAARNQMKIDVDLFRSSDHSKTWTPPAATDTLVGRASTDTLTNKSISGSTNTLTNISLTTAITGTLPVANGGTGITSGTSGGILAYTAAGTIASSGALTANQLVIGGGAGVAPSSLAAGTQYQVLTMGAANPGYGALNLAQAAAITGALPIGNGGTGQATKAAGFDALSPMTTSGDVIYGGSSGTGTRLAKGTDGDVLTLASGLPSWAAPGAATVPSRSYEISNLGIATSVGSSALTIALKQADGSTDPSTGTAAVQVGMRNATAATGGYAQRTATAALSTVISSGSTAGCTSAVVCYVYVYLIDNAGTLELAWSGARYDEGTIVTTTAEGGAGAADSNITMYSTTARTGVAQRLIGRLTITNATAGTWATNSAEISIWPFKQKPWYVYAALSGANPSMGLVDVSSYTEIINAGLTLTPFSGSAPAGTMCSTTNAATAPSTAATTCAAGDESIGLNFVIPEAGVYEVCAQFGYLIGVDDAEGINTTFQLIETPTNAQTLTLEGGTKINNRILAGTATGSGNSVAFPNNSCSFFNWSSAGTKGVRLMFEQLVTGAPNNSQLMMDALATVGQRNTTFMVKRLQ